MPRFTAVSWRCNLPCGMRHEWNVRECPHCHTKHFERYANVRESEQAMIDIDPQGNISVPGRLDTPLHPKQIAAGVQRVPVTSAIAGQHSLKHLEKLGLVHEATNWNSEGGNLTITSEGLDPEDLKPKSVEQILSEPDAF